MEYLNIVLSASLAVIGAIIAYLTCKGTNNCDNDKIKNE